MSSKKSVIRPPPVVAQPQLPLTGPALPHFLHEENQAEETVSDESGGLRHHDPRCSSAPRVQAVTRIEQVYRRPRAAKIVFAGKLNRCAAMQFPALSRYIVCADHMRLCFRT